MSTLRVDVDRDWFAIEFTRLLRHVLQKHEREVVARAAVERAGGAGHDASADGALSHANMMLDGAIGDLADGMYDALEQSQHEATHAH